MKAGPFAFSELERLSVPIPPPEFSHLCGSFPSYARRLIVGLLVRAIGLGRAGFVLSGKEAATLWNCDSGEWLEAVAWLSRQGILLQARAADGSFFWAPGPILQSRKRAIVRQYSQAAGA